MNWVVAVAVGGGGGGCVGGNEVDGCGSRGDGSKLGLE